MSLDLPGSGAAGLAGRRSRWMGLGLASWDAARHACGTVLAHGGARGMLETSIPRVRGALLNSLLLGDGTDALTDTMISAAQLIAAVAHGRIDHLTPDRGVGAPSVGDCNRRTGSDEKSGRGEACRRLDQGR